MRAIAGAGAEGGHVAAGSRLPRRLPDVRRPPIASTRTESLKAAQTLAGVLNIPLVLGTLYVGSKVLDSTVAVLVTAALALPLLTVALVLVAQQWRREEAVLGRSGRARAG